MNKFSLLLVVILILMVPVRIKACLDNGAKCIEDSDCCSNICHYLSEGRFMCYAKEPVRIETCLRDGDICSNNSDCCSDNCAGIDYPNFACIGDESNNILEEY